MTTKTTASPTGPMEFEARYLRAMAIRMVQTPESKLIEGLLKQIELARKALVDGKPVHALVEIEYAQVIANDEMTENPEILSRWYRKAQSDDLK